MAITELAAIEAAYQALQPLSPGARRRAVRWLSDALETEDDLILPDPVVTGVPARASIPAVPGVPAVGRATSTTEPAAPDVVLPAASGSGGAGSGGAGSGGAGSGGAGSGASASGVPAQGRPGRARRSGGRAGSGDSARSGGSGRAAAAPVPPRQRRRAGRPDNDRAYRRMPTADEVMAAYRTVGTVTGLAGHFGVPTHTVQGWARRLRGQGYQIGRGSRDT